MIIGGERECFGYIDNVHYVDHFSNNYFLDFLKHSLSIIKKYDIIQQIMHVIINIQVSLMQC